MTSFRCTVCKRTLPVRTEGGTGYGLHGKAKKKVCYDCCAELDKKRMQKTGTAFLYLTKDATGSWVITNWPGTLRFTPYLVRKGGHNWYRVERFDAWFIGPDGAVWHGVNLGDNEVLRCKRTKSRRLWRWL